MGQLGPPNRPGEEAFVAFWLVPALVSHATEMHPIVVVGIPANSVALKCPTPEYPAMP